MAPQTNRANLRGEQRCGDTLCRNGGAVLAIGVIVASFCIENADIGLLSHWGGREQLEIACNKCMQSSYSVRRRGRADVLSAPGVLGSILNAVLRAHRRSQLHSQLDLSPK